MCNRWEANFFISVQLIKQLLGYVCWAQFFFVKLSSKKQQQHKLPFRVMAHKMITDYRQKITRCQAGKGKGLPLGAGREWEQNDDVLEILDNTNSNSQTSFAKVIFDWYFYKNFNLIVPCLRREEGVHGWFVIKLKNAWARPFLPYHKSQISFRYTLFSADEKKYGTT